MIGNLVLVALIVAAMTTVALRGRVERRLALRNAARRKNEAALVIAGSLLGTALITGSYITGDTLDSSIRGAAYDQLGPIDEIIVVPDNDQAEKVEEELVQRNDPRIDGVMSITAVPASLSTVDETDALAEPEAQLIEADFADARAFGDDPEATGIRGPTPAPGEVAVTEDLAETLNARPGERVRAFLYGSKVDLKVDRVLPRLGIAGFWLGFESTSANAFVAPGTIAGLGTGKVPRGAIPPLSTILVSNRGDVEGGAALTPQVTQVIDDVVGAGGFGLRVEPVKSDTLDEAEVQGKEFGELFLGIGTFAIVAGVLLLVNIFVMLSEERKGQLGMLRAVGLKRAHLVRMFALEGFFYSIVAGVVGAFLGIGVGWAIVKIAAPIFSRSEEFALELMFSMTAESVVAGFSLGLLITTLTIVLTSVRISRINIIRAIRDLPEPIGRMARKRSVVFGSMFSAAMVAGAIAAFSTEGMWLAAMLCPPLAVFGLLPVLSRIMGRRLPVMLVSGLTLLWGIFGNTITGNRFFEEGDIFAFVVQGVLLTLSAVVLLSQTTDYWERVIRRVAARNLPVRLGIAYPIARRFRTGLTLGMYALVIFTMTFIAVLSSVFGGQVEETTLRVAGGFDVFATASASDPPTETEIESVDPVTEAATLVYGEPLFQTDASPEPQAWPASGYENDFVEIGPPEIEERDLKEFSTEAEVWTEVASDESLVVIPSFFLQEGGGPPTEVVEPGETIAVTDPVTGQRSERTVAAIYSDDYTFSGVFMSRKSLENILGARAAPSRFFIQSEGSGSENAALATELQGEFLANGVEADTFSALVEEFQAINLQFFELMQGYLALGLIVGIAGLGVVMVRAVRERRREIGVLRALGFLSPQVRKSFLLESGFTAIQGILIGAALALVTAAQLIATNEFGESAAFTVPWLQLAILCGTALLASLLATAWPAQQASQIPPAVALRVAE